ncbi:hypothetical protein [Desulfosediminicola flagellatus]|uniref:hypothetical protein n=1 Tax=Desulfosediminicola flagellatus TaxID=2569541 RepID=UPI0010ACA510|nr:hypothetical protein [Desulfosediminicola flagellatus]
MTTRNHITLYTLVLLLFGFSDTAWALQSHGPPEGIYVHQMAHTLFMAALAYLYWHTRRTQELTSKGWKYLQLFCTLLFCWNALAFTGHEALEYLTPQDFIDKNSWGEQLAFPLSFIKVLYYITKMDHFLMVPALFALVISLRTFYKQASSEAAK